MMMKSDTLREQEVERALDKINSIENMVDTPMFDTSQEDIAQVEIRVDNKVAHGMFIPSKAISEIWYASEQTFRAMKKDIFSLGNSIDEMTELYDCQSCHTQIDKQFWHFCPYCGERFLS
jgi:lipopolysaccharide biosynthesis regulator YciM